ncbi:glycerate kinase [Galactobacter caseinivorans]|uniref:Glycerate kinase n=1 Tax=Galactobacter caseinivorans TaxID=2676123 RepID=A0A496PJ40_9MICC|nr:glycerate kinase [Galactobacter caseinivorans]RKW70487.1 glycerate kinase [Galactobacter caseinivorans]
MRIVLAPDKFKGSLTAAQVASRLEAGLAEVIPAVDVVRVPMADGGEGTVEAALAAGFCPRSVVVTGPTGAPVEAIFALRGEHAVVEMAAASGLDVLPGGVKDALGATSRGTGELLAAALDAGARTIILGVGGSASTDGGAGLLEGLGARVLDAAGEPLPAGGGALARAARLDLSALDPRLKGTTLVLAADVDNPLTGARGAPAVFAPQKGASPEQVTQLDAALGTWARVVGQALGQEAAAAAQLPGAGAAGGVGYAALAVLGASRRPGVEVVAELVGLSEIIESADAVITGEGSLDEQSLGGKTPTGVAQAARRAGKPVWAVCGRTTLEEAQWRAAGFAGVLALSEFEPDPRASMARAGELVQRAGQELGRRLLAQAKSMEEDA